MDYSSGSSSAIESEVDSDKDTQFEEGIAAIRTGDLLQLKELLQNDGGKGSEIIVNGSPLIHYAIQEKQYDIVKYFLEKKSNVSCVNRRLQTPILVAAYIGDIKLVKMCIKYGAKLNYRDLKSRTPIHYAAMNGNLDVIALLYYHGASLDVRDLKGRTPLMFAAQGNHISVIEWLLQHHCRLLDQDSRGRSVLHWAVSGGSIQAVEFFLTTKYGYQLSRTVDFFRNTPLDFAQQLVEKECGQKRICLLHTLKLLRKYTHHRILFLCHFFKIHYLPVCFVPGFILAGVCMMGMTGVYQHISIFRLWLFGFVCLVVLGLWMWLLKSDAGVIHSKTSSQFELLHNRYTSMMDASSFVSSAGCSFCCIEKPIRCEHCLKCGHCIQQKDHHYAWLNNCVGVRNHSLFYIYLFFCIAFCIMLYSFGWELQPSLLTSLQKCLLVAFCVLWVLVSFYLGWLFCKETYHISRNITTNEIRHWRFYTYLQSNGEFRNPFDQGVVKNWLEFWGLIQQTYTSLPNQEV